MTFFVENLKDEDTKALWVLMNLCGQVVFHMHNAYFVKIHDTVLVFDENFYHGLSDLCNKIDVKVVYGIRTAKDL